MSSMEPPTAGWRRPGLPGDDPDALLRRFFRAELPHPWPDWAPPVRAAATPSRNGTGEKRSPWVPALRAKARSRLALAAAVGLLLVGTLVLSGKFHVPTPEPPPAPGMAKPIDDFIIKESLLQEVDEKAGPDGKTVKHDQPTQYRMDFYEH